MTSKKYFCNKCKKTHYSSGKIFYKHLKSSNSPRKNKLAGTKVQMQVGQGFYTVTLTGKKKPDYYEVEGATGKGWVHASLIHFPTKKKQKNVNSMN